LPREGETVRRAADRTLPMPAATAAPLELVIGIVLSWPATVIARLTRPLGRHNHR